MIPSTLTFISLPSRESPLCSSFNLQGPDLFCCVSFSVLFISRNVLILFLGYKTLAFYPSKVLVLGFWVSTFCFSGSMFLFLEKRLFFAVQADLQFTMWLTQSVLLSAPQCWDKKQSSIHPGLALTLTSNLVTDSHSCSKINTCRIVFILCPNHLSPVEFSIFAFFLFGYITNHITNLCSPFLINVLIYLGIYSLATQFICLISWIMSQFLNSKLKFVSLWT